MLRLYFFIVSFAICYCSYARALRQGVHIQGPPPIQENTATLMQKKGITRCITFQPKPFFDSWYLRSSLPVHRDSLILTAALRNVNSTKKKSQSANQITREALTSKSSKKQNSTKKNSSENKKQAEASQSFPIHNRIVPPPSLQLLPAKTSKRKKNATHPPVNPTIDSQFVAATYNTTATFPPNPMGAAGPFQYIIALSSLIKSFNKTTGQPDHVLNISLEDFFVTIAQLEGISTPLIKYDFFSKRWFILAATTAHEQNRIVIALSDTSVITAQTTWSFYYLEADSNVYFDFPTCGIDQNNLYVGVQVFSHTAQKGPDQSLYIIPKAPLINGDLLHATMFNHLVDPENLQGPFAAQGVDNFDANPSKGYFIAVDNGYLGRLSLWPIKDPASYNPSLEDPIYILVPSTQLPVPVRHKDNQLRTGRLDCRDDRLTCGHIRDGILYTVHNIGIDAQGESLPFSIKERVGCRWYEIDIKGKQPQLTHVGTAFSNQPNQVSFWIPSLISTPKHDLIIAGNFSGEKQAINSAIAFKKNGTKPLQLTSFIPLTNNTTSYNPKKDTGAARGFRTWGNYSATTLDPQDNASIWTIQQGCVSKSSWGIYVTKIKI